MKMIKTGEIKTSNGEPIYPRRPNPYYPSPSRRPAPYPDEPDTEDEE